MKINNIIFAALLLILPSCVSYVSKNVKIKDDNSEITFLESHKDYNSLAFIYYEKYQKKNKFSDLIKAADYYKLAKNFNKAINLYQILIDNNSNIINAYEGLIFAYIEIGETEKAKQVVAKIIAIDATRWRPIIAIALVMALNGSYSEALNYYDLALSIERNYSTLNNKALTLAFAGKLAESVSIMEEAANLVPTGHSNKEKISMNLALIYGLNGFTQEAKEVMNPYLNEEQIYNNLAVYAMLVNDQDKAKEYLYKALESNNHYQRAEDNLSVID